MTLGLFGTDIKILFRYQNLWTQDPHCFLLNLAHQSQMGPVLMTWLGRSRHLPVLLIYYPAILSWLSTRYPLPESQLCKPRNLPYTVNTLSQPGNMNLPSGFHAAQPRSYKTDPQYDITLGKLMVLPIYNFIWAKYIPARGEILPHILILYIFEIAFT